MKNIDIGMAILKNRYGEVKIIDISIDTDKVILENIDIDIEKNFKNIDREILRNIDIDKISNRLESGISNRWK